MAFFLSRAGGKSLKNKLMIGVITMIFIASFVLFVQCVSVVSLCVLAVTFFISY